MTLLIVQTILAGLGLITGVVIALFGPGKRWVRWPLAIATAAGIAFSARPEVWQGESSPIQQLYLSLSLSAIVALLALLVMTLLRPSSNAANTQEQYEELYFGNSSHSTPESDAAILAASLEAHSDSGLRDDTDDPLESGRNLVNIDPKRISEVNAKAKIASEDEHTSMHLPERENSELLDENHSELSEVEDSLLFEDGDSLLFKDEDSPLFDSASDNDSDDVDFIDWAEPANATADVVSLDDRREKNSILELELDDTLELDDELDLSNSDDIYQAMREAETELDLSHDPDWLEEGPSSGEISGDFTQNIPTRNLMDVEDAEILAEEALATPGLTESAQHHRSINQLSADTDALAKRLSEWTALSGDNEQSASQLQGQTVEQQHRRILAENDFRIAAVELIETQRDVMNEMMGQISTLGTQREEDLATLTMMQEKTLAQRRLARQAAFVARKAAADKRDLAFKLSEEQRNHERTRGAARRAMEIARDAVEKLSDQEKAHERSTEPASI